MPPKQTDQSQPNNAEADKGEGFLDSLEREFNAKFPLLSAAIAKLKEEGREVETLIVSAFRDGYRRGGVAHSTEGQELKLKDLQPEQIEAMLGDKKIKTDFA